MLPILAIFASLAASLANAQDPAGQLCRLTNCSGIDFGTYRGRPQFETPRPERERCLECEAEQRRQLAESIANMEHPKPVVLLAASSLLVLRQDVLVANAGMAAIEVGLGLSLSEVIVPALLIGAALMTLDAALDPGPIPIPVWLNALSLSSASAAARTCAELAAAAAADCAGLPASRCDSGDDCRTLLDKRAARLGCDKAWFDLRQRVKQGDCPAPPRQEAENGTENAREVADCGKLISGKEECCPDAIRKLKKAVCKSGAIRGCDENALTLDEIRGNAAMHCAAAEAKGAALAACRGAREAEATACYEGKLDASHDHELEGQRRKEDGCGSFLSAARRIGICP